jgi:probable rRNA maturation factor
VIINHVVPPVRVPGLSAWLSRMAPARARGELNVALLPDASVRALNRRFRGLDQSTDVLSFPSGEEDSIRTSKLLAGQRRSLGEIAIAAGVAGRQARRMGHTLQVEIRVLALHGLLHLLGYDHDRDDGLMRRVEKRLLRKAGLGDGLLDRAAARSLPGRDDGGRRTRGGARP